MASPTVDALAGFDFESDGVVDINEQLAHVWHGNSAYDDVGCALGFQAEALSGLATLAKHNIRPKRCRSQPFVMHAKDTSEPCLSCYSDVWFKLLAHEWSASDITPSFSGEGAEHCVPCWQWVALPGSGMPCRLIQRECVIRIASWITRGGYKHLQQKHVLHSGILLNHMIPRKTNILTRVSWFTHEICVGQ